MEPSKHSYKYQRLVNTLEREIHLNYGPGDRFPPELELCARFNLNRLTVHRAITLLAKKGLLVQKGRSGTYVADFDEAGYDNRLVCTAMGMRSHLWDKLFISLSYCAGLAEKFLLTVDLADHRKGEWASVRLSENEVIRRLKRCLSWHPRSLIIDFDISYHLPRLGNDLWHFRNLVLVQEGNLPAAPHTARVVPDRTAAFSMIKTDALKAGYKRICRFAPPPAGTPADYAGTILSEYPLFSEYGGLDALVEYVRGGEPAAVITYYDYGAHLVLQRLKLEEIHVPEQVGVYGYGNTPWTMRDDLTTIAFDTDLWAREVFKCLQEMEETDKKIEKFIPPHLIHGSTTRHVEQKASRKTEQPAKPDISVQ